MLLKSSLLTWFSFSFQIISGEKLKFCYIQPNIARLCLGQLSRSFVWRYMTKLSLLRLLSQDSEESLILTHFQTRDIFSSCSQTFKFMGFGKIVRELVLHHLHIWLPGRNVYTLSTTVHDPFNSAINWTADICSINSWVSIDIFSSCLWLNCCRFKTFISLTFYKCSFDHSITCGPWFFSWLFCFTNCKMPCIGNSPFFLV